MSSFAARLPQSPACFAYASPRLSTSFVAIAIPNPVFFSPAVCGTPPAGNVACSKHGLQSFTPARRVDSSTTFLSRQFLGGCTCARKNPECRSLGRERHRPETGERGKSPSVHFAARPGDSRVSCGSAAVGAVRTTGPHASCRPCAVAARTGHRGPART